MCPLCLGPLPPQTSRSAMSHQALTEVHCFSAAVDRQLLTLVRRGTPTAFDELYGRHKRVAESMARRETDNASDVEDVVAEAFLSVFRALSAGGGPRENFRSYLLTTTRRIAHQHNMQARRRTTIAHDPALKPAYPGWDGMMAEVESIMLLRALRSLPQRWQTVLRCIDLQGMKHVEVARHVGVSPNAVASLLIRAREGLRQAYLQEHVPESASKDCARASRLLGRFVRDALNASELKQTENHLTVCKGCASTLSDLRELEGAMRTAPRLRRALERRR
ncbi:RNA polymerase sigma factor [Paenarthrobacter sp. NPDC058040]|uniref:RNA polymerase sigma factor n=1 Tax=unclassified Paenarthrobacter TaxID=2634190 RepID=UPI0036D78FFF